MKRFEVKNARVISTSLLVLLLLITSAASVYAASCSETDGGKVYSVKGTVTTKDDFGLVTGSQTDQCDIFEITKLVEYYCGSGNTIKAQMVDCFCKEGKCDFLFSEPSCSYYDYSFVPPAGPVTGCAPGQSCCGSTCVSYGAGETVCCSLDGKKSDVCGASELCDQGTGTCIAVDCENPADPNYCSVCSKEYTCSDGEMNCGETCADGGGACLSGSEHTSGVYPVIEIYGIESSLLTDYTAESIEIYYSDIFRCFDGIDNDHDCLVDCADPDCSSETTFIDADGDGYGVKCGAVNDCDDTNPEIHTDCDFLPPGANITINNGDTYANNATAILSIGYSDDITPLSELQCRFSNDMATYSEWEACLPAKVWDLTGGDGVKTVYLEVKDNAGNINNTERDSIILDATNPSSSIIVIPNPASSFGNITFDVICLDSGSGCNTTAINTGFETCFVNHALGETNCTVRHNIECEMNTYTYSANTTDIARNSNVSSGSFEVKKKDGCSCVSADECAAGTCIGSAKCAKLEAPEIEFELVGGKEGLEIPLGKTKTVLVKVKNLLEMQDSIELSIYGDPQKIMYWTYFEGQKYKDRTIKTVNLGPKSEISVPLNVLGGEIGSYRLTVEGKSLTNGLKASKDSGVSVLYADEEGQSSKSPGLGWAGVLLILLFSSFLQLNGKSNK